MTDITGAIAELYAFDAYGNAIGFDPSVALTEFLYSGEQFDSKIGQQYLRARYYDPATGRFNRLDPFFRNYSTPQSFHKYLYCHADPIQGIDPSGLMIGGSLGMAIANTLGAGIRLAVAHPIITSGIVGGLIGAGWGAYNYGWRGAIGYGILGGASAATMATIIVAQRAGWGLLGILTLGYWGEYIQNGYPSYPKSEAHKDKIKNAVKLIRETPGFGPRYIPTTILIAKSDNTAWSGKSPLFAPFSIYLREEVLDLPVEFVASTIVHESVHQWQIPIFDKGILLLLGKGEEADGTAIPPYAEYSPYWEQSRFLNTIFQNKYGTKVLTMAGVQEKYPSDSDFYHQYLQDIIESFANVEKYKRSQDTNSSSCLYTLRRIMK